MGHMTKHDIWAYSEAQSHWEEILQLAANGEPQRISRPDGVTLVIQMQPEQAEPFVPVLAAFAGLPVDTELVTERPQDQPRDVEL
ncbi:hypothetical protein GCM10017783_21720 [Deinococcus piscis]|uniref:DUF4911 domain-containing protein n=2 Tax=Deinococcus piscis TaxID=394230 RepID=A0ABQ3K9Z5_9DEIO|nr:hypothetical protein GCM10017783_21720 [Deinococcus piscis]